MKLKIVLFCLILAGLAVIFVGGLKREKELNKKVIARIVLTDLIEACESYFHDHGVYPIAGDSLQDEVRATDTRLMSILLGLEGDGGEVYYSQGVRCDFDAVPYNGLHVDNVSGALELLGPWANDDAEKMYFYLAFDYNGDGIITIPCFSENLFHASIVGFHLGKNGFGDYPTGDDVLMWNE